MMGEIIRELPKSWLKVTLQDVAHIDAGNPAPQKKEYFINGTYSFIRVQDLGRLNGAKYLRETKDKLNGEGIKNLKLFKKGSVLFTKSGASTLLNQRAILEQDSYVVSHIGVAYPNENILSEWLFYWLKRIDFAKYAHGANMPSMPLSKAKGINIPLAPLNEQKQIVDKIERLFSDLDEGEALLKTIQKQLSTYRQSVLKAAVTGELTNSNYNCWQEYNVGGLIEDIRYGTSKKCSYDSSKTPVLRIPNIAEGKIDLSDLKYTDFTEKEMAKLALEEGDLLLVRSNGSVSLVGLSAIVDGKVNGCAYAGYLIRLRVKKEIILPEFLNVYLHSPLARNRIESQARSTSGVHNINSDEVKSIPLRIPDLAEQERIIDRVADLSSQIDALEKWCETELTRSQALRQSILKDAFSGRLVPQDPNDEPASELLKLIQAEKGKKLDKRKE